MVIIFCKYVIIIKAIKWEKSRSKNIHALHSNTDKIFNYSITTTCELHTERKFIVIQEFVTANPKE